MSRSKPGPASTSVACTMGFGSPGPAAVAPPPPAACFKASAPRTRAALKSNTCRQWLIQRVPEIEQPPLQLEHAGAWQPSVNRRKDDVSQTPESSLARGMITLKERWSRARAGLTA